MTSSRKYSRLIEYLPALPLLSHTIQQKETYLFSLEEEDLNTITRISEHIIYRAVKRTEFLFRLQKIPIDSATLHHLGKLENSWPA